MPASPHEFFRLVVRPWRNGMQITRRTPERWIIDFGTMPEHEAAFFTSPFAYVVEHVKPKKDKNNRDSRKKRWWQHSEVATGMRRAVSKLDRYIATSRVSKFRVFVWLDSRVVPDDGLTIIAREDDTMFGILQSKYHALWGDLLLNRRGAEGDQRYAATTALATFPFPDGLTPDLPADACANSHHGRAVAAAMALVEARERWLNPASLVELLPEVVGELPGRLVPKSAEAAVQLRRRTLTNLYDTRGTPSGAWLDGLHRTLDEAVAAAYGWPSDIADSDALERLLKLNQERAEVSDRQAIEVMGGSSAPISN